VCETVYELIVDEIDEEILKEIEELLKEFKEEKEDLAVSRSEKEK